jgi:diguanylate cyclase (GGDEF)-like protein/PAS domain S-box-containing protein
MNSDGSKSIDSFLRDGLLDSDEKFRALVEHSVVGIYIIQNGKFSYVNSRLAKIFGYGRDELIGKSNLDLTYKKDQSLAADNVKKRLNGDIDHIEYTFRGITKTGKIKYIHTYGSVFHYEGERAIIGTLIDETEMVLAKKRLEKLANHDNLTGVLNRHAFLEGFNRAIKLGKRRGHYVALILFDIDNLKHINDSLGHKMGDVVLKKTAKRIRKMLRESDLFARIGGDEFAIIVEDYSSTAEISSLIHRLQKKMEKSVIFNETEMRISLSIGVSLYPKHGQDIETLQKAADIAMYEVKRNGKNHCLFYSEDSKELLAKIQMENELASAIENEEFKLYLQPQINLKNKKSCYAEALIRWDHPEKGIILPEQFLPLASESGLLYKLDLYMIERVLTLLKSWKKALVRKFTISINISNALFQHQQFLPTMKKMRKKYGKLIHYVELELTEEILMRNKKYSDQLISSLKSLGFGLSVDDFGVGYSSLRHLKRLDVDKIKIDRTFIKEMTQNNIDKEIVEAIIAMGRSLKFTVLAEGTETKKQVKLLKKMGCNIAQGHYYAKARPVEIFEKNWL